METVCNYYVMGRPLARCVFRVELKRFREYTEHERGHAPEPEIWRACLM